MNQFSHLGAFAVGCQRNFRSHLQEKFRRVFEGIAKAGQATDLNDFYIEIFITERDIGDVNQEHEVRLIETASRKPAKRKHQSNVKTSLNPYLDKINQSER